MRRRRVEQPPVGPGAGTILCAIELQGGSTPSLRFATQRPVARRVRPAGCAMNFQKRTGVRPSTDKRAEK
jgi:hypothetical protein